MPVASIADIQQRVGGEVGVTHWILVDQARIDAFAEATDDHQFIHVDPEAAARTPFGGTIAHGFLTLSLLSHLAERTFSFADRRMGINYGLNRVRFTAPLKSGSRVRARFKLLKRDGHGRARNPQLVGHLGEALELHEPNEEFHGVEAVHGASRLLF